MAELRRCLRTASRTALGPYHEGKSQNQQAAMAATPWSQQNPCQPKRNTGKTREIANSKKFLVLSFKKELLDKKLLF
jgi:hypothetical protein